MSASARSGAGAASTENLKMYEEWNPYRQERGHQVVEPEPRELVVEV